MIVYPRQEDDATILRQSARAYFEKLVDAAKNGKKHTTPFDKWLESSSFNLYRSGYLSDEVLQLLKEAWDISRKLALKEK